MFENTRIAGVAHRRHDPVYTVRTLSPATVSTALARRGVPVGSIIRDDDRVRFTAPGTDTPDVVAALGDLGVTVAVRGDLGSVSVVSTVVGNRPEITARILDALERTGIDPHLVTSTPSRVSCHIPAGAIDQAARVLHDAFDLHTEDAGLAGAAAAVPVSGRAV
jgi:aspartate kinase